MPGDRGPAGVPLSRVRQLLALRVEQASLRQVAREIGMSPSGVQKLLDGSSPYTATRRKLTRWYVRETGRYGGALSAGSAAAALEVLLDDLAPGSRDEAYDRLVHELEEIYAAGGVLPAWLIGLRDGP